MKKLTVLFALLITVLFSFTAVAQKISLMRKDFAISFPEKIHKLVLDPLPAGTYSVGAGGYFPTIDSAFNKLSIDGIAGEVVLELIDNLYIAPTDTFGFFLNGPIPGAGPNNRVAIKPAANKNVTIEGSCFAVVHFLNTNYVTVDGVGLTGATTLTIHSLQNLQFPWNVGLEFMDNSDHNIVQNTIFISEDYTRGGIGGPAFYPNFFAGSPFAPDSNLIQNNFIKKSAIAIYVSAEFSAVKAIGNIVRGNIVGLETDSLIGWGIQAQFTQNTIIENNIIQNLRRHGNAFPEDLVPGINSFYGTGDIIRNNIVHNIKSSAGYTSTGILLSGDIGKIGSNNSVYNNMVYDIQSTSTATNSRVAGIQLWNQNNPKIYYNSVYLSGIGANHQGSAALFIYNNCSNVESKNNILVNTRDESPYCASSIYDFSASNLTSDYNDLYYQTNQYNCLVKIGGTNYLSLSDWQATGKDLNSISELPNFTDPYLHVDETLPSNLERGATPIAIITADFDGDLRNAVTPDIGADEFDGFTYEDPLPAGTYTVGTGGNFETIQHCFDLLSQYGISGNVILELIDNLYTAPTNQYGFFLNGPIPGAGANSRVTIKPAANKNVTIEGNGLVTVSLLNTSYVTIDGVALTGSTTLTIHTLSNNAYDYDDGIDFMDNSDHNVMQNIVFINEDGERASGSGFVSDNLSLSPDSNLIQNNFVKQSGVALYAYGNPDHIANGNIFRGNIIGTETDSLIAFGIIVSSSQNTIIENNIIQNLRLANSWEALNAGIYSFFDSGDIIRNNIVHNIKSSAGYSSVGIFLSGENGYLGSNNSVYNNMVYDIQSTSTQSVSRVTGIQMLYQNNPKIYYNSVYLEGNGNGANPYGSAALYISNNCTNAEAKNNILVNTRDESPYCASALYDYSVSNLTSDYNDLFYTPTQYSCLVRIGSTNYQTLADWQATGQDSNSVSEMPNFVSPDLHIDSTIYTLLNNHATPIAEITTDIDNNPRNLLTPDIGADEFDFITGIEGKSTPPIEFALEQNYPNPFNPSTKIKYSIPQSSNVVIKVFGILGNEMETLVNEEKSVGTYEVTWYAENLPSGVYFYQLKAGDFISTKKMLLLK